MEHKKKAKLQKLIFTIVFMGCFGLIGGFVGYYITEIQKNLGKDFNIFIVIIVLVLVTFASSIVYFINICLHEVGHVLFGLLTGYRFSSLRFGSFMIVKVEGKLKIKKMSIAGTGGQALMLAPEGDEADYPVFLYNIGGLIVNFITCIICWIVYFQINNKLSIVAVIILVFAIMSLACFVINALPLSELGTDGSNALLLVKNRDARIVLRKMLTINKLLADNVPLKDMPQELFISDNDNQLDNPLVTTQAVNEFNYYVINKQFDKAKQFGNYILENVKSINNLHYLAVKSDLIYITIVIDKDNEKAREIFKRNAKEYKNMVRMISFNRMLYAYYSLCDVDKKKAEKSKNMFIKLGENYPYKEDYRVEKELIDLVDDELNKQSRGVN